MSFLFRLSLKVTVVVVERESKLDDDDEDNYLLFDRYSDNDYDYTLMDVWCDYIINVQRGLDFDLNFIL